MFACIICSDEFTKEDIEKALYFPSTGVCTLCYKKLMRSKVSCFGKEKLYAPRSLACSDLCPDKRICKFVIMHRKEFKSIGG